MRRPGKTKAQREYDRTQRALLRLRRAAVRWSEGGVDIHPEDLSMLRADVEAACDAYTTSLSPRERRKLLK